MSGADSDPAAARRAASLPAMCRALVLNVTEEPLGAVASRRAAVLVFDGRADSLSDSGEVLRSEHLEVPVPSVVRLRYFVRVPYQWRGSISRRGVFARDGHSCQYCGARADSIDHVRPRSRGGGHTWDNVVAACRPCNSHKRDRLLTETSMRLRRAPTAPPRDLRVVLALGDVPEGWAPFLPGVPDALSA